MKRQMWVVAFIAVAFTSATLVAQTSGTSSSREQSPTGTVTLTGCLEKGSSSGAAGTTGSTSGTSASSSSASGGQFVLSNAQMGSGSSSRSSTSGTSGTSTSGTSSPSSSASSSGSRYILDGQESELTKHVGEKVEITGTLASSSSSTSSSGTAGTTPSASSSSGGQRVRVQSVKTIASSCS